MGTNWEIAESMARELTTQMTDASRELADATRARQQLESQLSELQHQMASPDGIVTSGQFVEDASRLRREIQLAIVQERDATTARDRLSAQESQATAASRISTGASASTNRGAGNSGPQRNAWRSAAMSMRNNISQSLQRERSQQKLMKQREEQEFAKRGAQVKPPNKFIYFPLIYLAVIIDVFGLLTLTGVGAFVVAVIDIVASIFFFLISLWLGRKIKNVRVSGESAAKLITGIEQRIVLYRQNIEVVLAYASRSRAGRSILRSAVGRRVVNFATRSIAWTRKPIVRNIGTNVMEQVPILNLFPWYTINMILTYREHAREYKLSVESLAQYAPKSMEEQATFATLHQSKIAQGTAIITGIANGLFASQRARGTAGGQTDVQDITPAEATT